ncbi:MAG: prolyl oligopeptidase family serine peptidase [Muribaculaceae bacterium]|nr:prolyl oligopeptidase family serine peptidase [Muribaculaceae bacterium]
MKKIFITGLLAFSTSLIPHAEKKILDHTSFDDWKKVVNDSLSKDGAWGAYEVNPQEGDGVLTFYSTKDSRRVTLSRGYCASFTSDGKWALALVKPLFQQTRDAKIKKLSEYEMPADSLAIVDLLTLSIDRIPYVKDYKIGKNGTDWVAYTSCDTTLMPADSLLGKERGRPVVVRNLKRKESKVIKNVAHYVFSNDGQRLALTLRKAKGDSLSTAGVGVMFMPETSFVLLDRDKTFYGAPVFDESGNRLAFIASNDTIESGTRDTSLFYSDLSHEMRTPVEFTLDMKGSDGTPLRPNQYTVPKFSHNGRRLIGGVAPVIAPDDTTKYDFETAELDIWRWDAPFTPPQERNNLEETRKLNFPVVIDLSTGRKTLVTSNPLASVQAPDRWDGDNVLILDPTDDIISTQWNYYADETMNVLNLFDGSNVEIGKCHVNECQLSPCDKYVVWFRDKNFYTYNIATGTVVNISDRIPYPVWNDTDDHPAIPMPFESPFWSKDDKEILVYDRYDIWALDPEGRKEPVCLTKGEGRKRNLRFRYIDTDSEQRFVTEGEEMLLEVFDYKDKYNGLATLKYSPRGSMPKLDMLNGFSYTQVNKAKDAQVYSWVKANFSTSPDVWCCRGTDFMKAVKLSDANPQMKDYRWGTAQLVKWNAYDGKESEGVLYVPDDIDPDKKYPMLCVFYETGSERLYNHFNMEPSWSWVNYPFYVSRGYVIFVPDIHYTAGVPGESCYNYVCSGAEEMCRRYPWIDKDRIGIDGQSWGGYQTAYLVTRTDMFACAGSGAPVSNMTSAFGGIRWESGDSRQAQYEVGQSRIGRNLWEAPELYILNSPVFHANRVKTPLLIMHNDGDGAVPWYQGIEMFMALRRLNKPVWMLQYNGEAHNIVKRKNRKDITVRLQQFFDHYLKGDPMPKWMKEGIPMIRKGQEMNYE